MKLILKLAISVSLFSCCCYADDANVDSGAQCAPVNSTWSTESQTSLNTVLNSLEANVNLHNGFYTTTAGKKTDRIYGLIQCRGDIPQSDCANCTRNSFKLAPEICSRSKSVAIWQRHCFLRYSNISFFGKWEKAGALLVNWDNSTENPFVASRGVAMMGTLVSKTPKEPLMFGVSEVDAGPNGKRYGMAQCTRDLSRSQCGKCLDNLLASFPTNIGKERSWEAQELGCRLWYDDYKFYYKFLTPVNDGTKLPENIAGRVLSTIPFLLLFILHFESLYFART